MATPAASADWYSFSVSTLSGSFTHRKMPPLVSSNSADVPNCSLSASIRVSSLARRPRVSFGTCAAKCGAQYSASTICSSAPALRVGYIVAPWAALSRMLALKTDAGSGALEQMVLAEYCAPHFAAHVPKLTRGLRAKLDTLMEALNAQFGTSAEFEDSKGGIFLWVKLPDNVDTLKLYQSALAAGVAINPGPEWSTDKAYAGSRLRLCFASPTHQQIRDGVAVLAEVCRKEFGV